MSKRMIAPIIFGIVGIAILVSLGNWQVRRLAWKEAILAEVDARLAAAPVALPDAPNAEEDLFLSVEVSGQMGEREIHVLSSSPATGPGYRVITSLELPDGRRIMIDRGIVPEAYKDAPRPPDNGPLYGNLYWLQQDIVEPEPNLERNIWFTRDPVKLAAALNTEPVLVVLSHTTLSTGPIPTAIGNNIPNKHLGYAVTWYLFALVWLGMTLYLLVRIKRKTV